MSAGQFKKGVARRSNAREPFTIKVDFRGRLHVFAVGDHE
jgi:hypothetical protein